MKRLIVTLGLLVTLLISMTACDRDAPVFHEHVHTYIATHTAGTCLTYGHTEYRCHCGDRYTVTDTEYGEHTPPVLPTVDTTQSPDAIIIRETTEHRGIQGSYCDDCGVYMSFERRDKTPIHLGQ